MTALRKILLSLLVLVLPLGGCSQMPNMFSNDAMFSDDGMLGSDGLFSFLHRKKKLPTTDSAGHRLSRGIVVAVRNVRADALPKVDTDTKDKKDKDDEPHKAIEYRILQDDGTTLVVVTQGDETDAITPGQRVLVVHDAIPRVMLETPLSDRQGT